MFERILKQAYETGGEVIVDLKYCGDLFQGRVYDLESDAFTLYHSGPQGGVLWAFKLEDVAYCGLRVAPPVLEPADTPSEKQADGPDASLLNQ